MMRMSGVMVLTALLTQTAAVGAQVINGESTDESAYQHRPPVALEDSDLVQRHRPTPEPVEPRPRGDRDTSLYPPR